MYLLYIRREDEDTVAVDTYGQLFIPNITLARYCKSMTLIKVSWFKSQA